jgi:competence protein ComEA
MTFSISKLFRRILPVAAVCALVASMGGTWGTAESVAAPAVRPAPAVGSNAQGTATQGAAARATATAPTAASADRSAGADAGSASDEPDREKSGTKRSRGPATITGKLNLNTATEEQLMLLPTVGPSKAERIITWRKKNGAFKRVADLRRVKGFGYKTFKRLEPYLDITGETTLAVQR